MASGCGSEGMVVSPLGFVSTLSLGRHYTTVRHTVRRSQLGPQFVRRS